MKRILGPVVVLVGHQKSKGRGRVASAAAFRLLAAIPWFHVALTLSTCVLVLAAIAPEPPPSHGTPAMPLAAPVPRAEIADRRWIAIAQAEPARDADLAVVGDSIVAFGDWQQMLGRPVARIGVCGGRTTDIAECVLAASRPGRTIVVAIGVNDVFDRQGTADEISARVVGLAEQARGAGATVVVSLPLLTRHDAHNPGIATLRASLAPAAEAAGIRTIDPCPALCEGGKLRADYTTDGIHLTAAGYAVVGGAMREALVAD